MENVKKSVNELLKEKLQEEYNEFIVKLKAKTIEEVIDRAYEKAIKEELLNVYLNTERTEEETKAMFSEANVLDVLYQEWLSMDDCEYEEAFNRCVERCADSAVRRNKKNSCA